MSLVFLYKKKCKLLKAGLHDYFNWDRLSIRLFTWSNKSGFFGRPAFSQPIRSFRKLFKLLWLAGWKPALHKSQFCYDHVNRLYQGFFPVNQSQSIKLNFSSQSKAIEKFSKWKKEKKTGWKKASIKSRPR